MLKSALEDPTPAKDPEWLLKGTAPPDEPDEVKLPEPEDEAPEEPEVEEKEIPEAKETPKGDEETSTDEEPLDTTDLTKIPLDESLTFVMKVNGKEVTEKATLAELIEGRQKTAAADEKFQEAAKQIKDAEGFYETLLGDPFAALVQRTQSQHKVDRKKAESLVQDYFERWLSARYEYEALPEHERGRLEVAREKKELDTERQKWERQRKEAEESVQVDDYLKKIDKGVMDALTKAKIKPEPTLLGEVFGLIHKGFDLGKEIQPADALSAVLKERDRKLSDLLENLTDEELAKRTSKRQEAARATKQKLRGEAKQSKGSTSTSKSEKKPERISESDWIAASLRG